MKVLLNQLLVELKLFFREPISVFWTFFFPLVIIACIGWFFTDTNNSGSIYYFDEDLSEKSIEFIDIIKEENPDINLKKIEKSKFNTLLNNNKGELVLHLKKDFQNNIEIKKATSIDLFYNHAYGSNSDFFLSSIFQTLPKINIQLFNKPNNIEIKKVNLGLKEQNSLRYIDFLTPGIIAMSVMSTCLFGVGIGITSQREKGQLRRLALTPVDKSVFILSYILFRYIIVLLQAILLIIAGFVLFNIHFHGDIFSLISVLTVGLLTFVSIGYLIASQSKKTEVAAAIANLLFFPMLLLGGVYFPVDNVPDILKPFVEIIPLYHLTESLRQVINYGEPVSALLYHQGIQIIIFGVCFLLTIKLFKWE